MIEKILNGGNDNVLSRGPCCECCCGCEGRSGHYRLGYAEGYGIIALEVKAR